MSWQTMVFSEKWFEIARRYLKGESKYRYLEAVLNYGLFGNNPEHWIEEDPEALRWFQHAEYEIELLNPKLKKYYGDFMGYLPLDDSFIPIKPLKEEDHEEYGLTDEDSKEE